MSNKNGNLWFIRPYTATGKHIFFYIQVHNKQLEFLNCDSFEPGKLHPLMNVKDACIRDSRTLAKKGQAVSRSIYSTNEQS